MGSQAGPMGVPGGLSVPGAEAVWGQQFVGAVGGGAPFGMGVFWGGTAALLGSLLKKNKGALGGGGKGTGFGGRKGGAIVWGGGAIVWGRTLAGVQ